MAKCPLCGSAADAGMIAVWCSNSACANYKPVATDAVCKPKLGDVDKLGEAILLTVETVNNAICGLRCEHLKTGKSGYFTIVNNGRFIVDDSKLDLLMRCLGADEGAREPLLDMLRHISDEYTNDLLAVGDTYSV